MIQIAALAAVLTPSLLLTQTAALFKVSYGAFNGASGQLQLFGDGTNRRVAFAVLICSVIKVHIDCPGAMRKL